MTSRKPARSKRGMVTTVAPARRLQGRIRLRPMAWKNGATPTTTSSALNPSTACSWRALATRLAWVVVDQLPERGGAVGLAEDDHLPDPGPGRRRPGRLQG